MEKKAVSEAEELPKTIVRRVVKEKLSQCSYPHDFIVHKEALLAFSEGARIFIHYLSATANDLCKESRRRTINAEDVLKALEEIEFSEFVKPLKASLEEFRRKNAGKRASASKAKEGKKKRKAEEPSPMSEDSERKEEEEEDEKEEKEDENGSGEE